MTIPVPIIAKLLREVQGEATTLVWSQGVTLTRKDCSFVATTLKASESVIHVRIPGKPVSPKVTLWPEEEEWDCDCRSQESPCEHVAATVIMLKQGKVALAGATEEGNEISVGGAHVQIQYHFTTRERERVTELEIHREIGSGNSREVFKKTILSYKSAVQNKRTKSPDLISSQADFQVEQILGTYRGGALERVRLEALFKAFEPDQKIFLDDEPVELSTSMLLPKYECVDEADGYRLRRKVNPDIHQQFRHGVALCGNTLHLMKSTFLLREEQAMVEGEGSFWGAEREGTLFNKIIPTLQKKIIIEVSSLKAPQSIELPPRITIQLEKDQLHDGRYCLSAVANLVYGDPEIARVNPRGMEVIPQGGSLKDRKRARGLKRNVEKERDLLKKLSSELNLQIGRHAEFQNIEAVQFCEKLKGWDFTGDAYKMFAPQERLLVPDLKAVDASGDSGDVEFSVKFLNPGVADGAGSELDFKRVMSAWELNEDYVPLLDGSWAKVPKDWLDQYGRKIQDFLASRDATKVTVPKHEQIELSTLCEDLGVELPDTTKQLKSLVDNFSGIKDARLPKDLKADLRSYQKDGVNWLHFLKDAGLGAMLADDMGLGKTLQMLCVLEKRSLVVAPTSVLYNWGAEIKKFRPNLKVSYFYGPDRKLDLNSDIVLTSYGVLRMDQDKLANQEWKTIVLDEAQVIKNPDSLVAKAAHSLRGDFKATLTGTPIENHLKDLWSQFHFINPGMLGSLKDFIDGYSKPISGGDPHTAQRLRRKIKPFILRRLKKEVAKELPEKTELLLHCELSKEEREVYNTLMSSTRKEVLASLDEGGSVMEALELILRLRQACCHIAMVPGQEPSVSSSKVELLMNSLEESIEEGHKSLVFSQWTSFLDLIAAELKQKNIPYLRIDGSTRNRQDIVDRFQGENLKDGESPEPVLLISLKAGGVGLTLTAADHVFIMDPWWNPAVEAQAADRAYRIGQKNPVFVHRLVAQGTLEEKIVELQEKKKDLAKAVLEEGGAALSLTRGDIMDLLS